MMYSCDQCGTKFTKKSSVTRHKNGRCLLHHRRDNTSVSKYPVSRGDESSNWDQSNEILESMRDDESTDQEVQQPEDKLRVDNGICNYSWRDVELSSSGDESSEDESILIYLGQLRVVNIEKI